MSLNQEIVNEFFNSRFSNGGSSYPDEIHNLIKYVQEQIDKQSDDLVYISESFQINSDIMINRGELFYFLNSVIAHSEDFITRLKNKCKNLKA